MQIKVSVVSKNLAHRRSTGMYKEEKSVQMTFEVFSQTCGMKLNVLFGTGLSCFVFYFEDAPDGVASFDLVEVQDDAA